MKAVIIGPAPPLRGGIAKHTKALSDALERRGHATDVISYSRLYPKLLFPGRSEREDTTSVGAALVDTLNPFTWRRVRQDPDLLAADVVVVQWWHPVTAPALRCILKSAHAPVVVICHNLEPHEAFPGARPLARTVLRRASALLCHSRAIAREAASFVPDAALAVSPMPMLIRPPSKHLSRKARTDPAALFLGYVRPYKGVDVLLRAWRRARLPAAATLTIAGESYLGRGELERLAAEQGGRGVEVVNRYLPDADLWDRLSRARVLVLPYRRGTQSGWLPLAMAAGVRVIASDAGGLAEPLRGDERHQVVRAGDEEALARSLERVLGPGDAAVEGFETDNASRQYECAADAMQNSWRPTVDVLERVAASRSL